MFRTLTYTAIFGVAFILAPLHAQQGRDVGGGAQAPGGSQIVLLQVNTSATYTPWISIAPFNKTFTVRGQAMMPTGQY